MSHALFGQLDSLFKRGTSISQNKDTLNYRWASPVDMKAGEKYPLVIFLHGAGERGNDNQAQLLHGAKTFVSPKHQKARPAFVLAPQCPTGKKWVNINWKLKSNKQPDTISIPLEMVIQLIKSMKDSLPIDSNRIYITGLSMGGFGTWDAITRYPDLFAAAVPVCGGGDEATAGKLKNMPLWVFHGDADKVIYLERSTNMVEAIKKTGNKKIKYTIYPKVGHDSWTQTYANEEVHKWLFHQRKK